MKHSKNQISVIRISSIMIILLAFTTSQAQKNLNITFRPGANFPVKNLGETKLNTGGGFEVTIAYRFIPHFQAYAGWGWNSFSEEESTVNSNLQFEETGYTFGLQFIHPFASESKLNFMIGGGGIYNHIETANSNSDIINDTGHGLGWQAETGIAIPIGHHDRWQIMPTVRYRALSGDMTIDGVNATVDLSYFSAGMGVTWILWKTE